MARKQRSDSAAAAINAMVNAATPLPAIPAHVRVREQDLLFWDGILRARAREEWTAADLVVAAQLARCQADIESESVRMEDEGSVIENAKGTPVMNPRVAVLEQLCRREMALFRALQIGGSARGDKRDMVQARKIQQQAEAVRESMVEDDLLAT